MIKSVFIFICIFKPKPLKTLVNFCHFSNQLLLTDNTLSVKRNVVGEIYTSVKTE